MRTRELRPRCSGGGCPGLNIGVNYTYRYGSGANRSGLRNPELNLQRRAGIMTNKEIWLMSATVFATTISLISLIVSLLRYQRGTDESRRQGDAKILLKDSVFCVEVINKGPA